MENILDTAENRALAKAEEMAEKQAVKYEDEKQRRQLRNGIRDLLQSGIRLMRMETENVIDEVQTLNNTKAQC